MKITAAVKRPDTETFGLEEVELDAPRDDEVLVKIAGVVSAVGANVTEFQPGDRVAIPSDPAATVTDVKAVTHLTAEPCPC